MEEIAATWKSVGPSARNVFLMQKVDELTRIVMGTVTNLKVSRLTVLGGIGGSNGAGTPGADLTGRVIAASEHLKAATGVDLLGAVRDRMTGGPPKPPPPQG
jgi:flotillin